jgi:hypothetical protein
LGVGIPDSGPSEIGQKKGPEMAFNSRLRKQQKTVKNAKKQHKSALPAHQK